MFKLAIESNYGQLRFKDFDTRIEAVKHAKKMIDKAKDKYVGWQQIEIIDETKDIRDDEWRQLLYSYSGTDSHYYKYIKKYNIKEDTQMKRYKSLFIESSNTYIVSVYAGDKEYRIKDKFEREFKTKTGSLTSVTIKGLMLYPQNTNLNNNLGIKTEIVNVEVDNLKVFKSGAKDKKELVDGKGNSEYQKIYSELFNQISNIPNTKKYSKLVLLIFNYFNKNYDAIEFIDGSILLLDQKKIKRVF